MFRPVTRERVLDVALDILEAEGVEALTMRALAAKLGVAVTAIYWHVGNKETLLDELGDRIAADVGRVRRRGSTPVARILSVARSLRRNLLARPHLVAILQQQGRPGIVFVPARRLLTEDFTAAGLRDEAAVVAVNAVVHHVVGSVLLERATARSHDDVFEHAIAALVRGLISSDT